jgi:hypothetical protein
MLGSRCPGVIRIGIRCARAAGLRPREAGMAFTHEIRADAPRNRLYMRLVGFMTEADAVRVADALIAEYAKLRPGFVIINDIRDLKPTTQEASTQMRRAQEAAIKHGYGRAIRVIGDQVVTHMQWSRTLKAAHGVEAETAATMEEAERILDGGAPRSSAKPEPPRRPGV